MSRSASRPAAAEIEKLESRFWVTIDATAVHCRHPDGKDDHLAWADLRAVFIETNGSGSIGAEVWWVLIDREGKVACTVPHGATGELALADALFKLPAFDRAASVKAMARTEDNISLCWRRLPTDDDAD